MHALVSYAYRQLTRGQGTLVVVNGIVTARHRQRDTADEDAVHRDVRGRDFARCLDCPKMHEACELLRHDRITMVRSAVHSSTAMKICTPKTPFASL
jgi:hypothetical protein